MEDSKEISILIPLYNEEENIVLLYKRIKQALLGLKKAHEIIFIDDGSSDNGLLRLKEIQKKDGSVRIIVFRRNFGQSAAISAGFLNSRGKILIVMDADLQNDPSDIRRLLKKIGEGYDVVSGWRYAREDSIFKILSSKISNWMHRKMTGLKIHDSGCSLKAYTRDSVKDLELYGEMHRYIRALIAVKGFNIGEIKVEHHFRKHGKSKYGSSRLIRGFLDLMYIHFLTKYSSRPLHFFGYIGIVPIILGIVIGAAKSAQQAAQFFSGVQVVASPLLLFSVFLIIVGILFIIFGFLAEMIIRMQNQNVKGKNYSIKEIIQ